MATVPLSGTNIRFLSGVPFTNDYKNTRWFDTVTQQTAYFESKPVIHNMLEANFQRIEGYHFISVNKSIDELWNTNYLMFRNAQYNNKWFYAFVTKLEYIQKNTTYVHFQIDVLQTWRFEFNFQPSFVVREHCKLWNDDGSPVINTVDEGLDYGTEYDTVSVTRHVPFKDIYFLVIVSKSLLHDREIEKAGDIFPTINASPQPLCYYVHPFKLDGTIPSVWDGTEEIVLSSPIDVLKAIYKLTDAVNNIVSIYVTDYIGINFPYDGASNVLTMSPANFVNVSIHDTTTDPDTFLNTVFLLDVKNYQTKESNYGSKWSGYNGVYESKLLMSPYTQLVLDDFKGNRVNLKNEHISNTNDLIVLTKGSLGTSNKVSYGVKGYNFSASSQEIELSNESALINNDPNDIPIITDMLSAYLQGNRNSIQNQQNSIIFNGLLNTFSGVSSAVSGGVSGAIGGSMLGPAGAIGGAVGGAMNGVVSAVSGAGNSVLQMQGLQAKQKDIANIPPALSKMGSNSYYSTGNDYNGLYIIKKQIKAEYRKKLQDFFNAFGYKVNEIKLPNLHTRQSWNYIQTENCILKADINHEDLRELKAIFDGGITLWHVDDIGNYALSNGVI